MTLQQRIPLVRDLVTLALGAGGFIHSVLTGADWPAFLVSAALMAGPGVVQLWLLRTQVGGSSSPLVSPDPPAPPSLPSSVPSAGEP